MVAAAGCGKAPPAPPAADAPITIAARPEALAPARMTLAAAADANPDGTGRPSPIVVRVYQLRSDAAFSRAEFVDLFDDEQMVLGPELITRDEYTLVPAERQIIAVSVQEETRFVGAIAAFRDIRNAQWRAVVPAPRQGLDVSVERARIVLSGAD